MEIDLKKIRIRIASFFGQSYDKVVEGLTLKEIVSYTTRGMREGETNGVEHWFVSNPEADEILANESLLAYTEIGENRYFATKERTEDCNLYIIDPNGIKNLEKNSDREKRVIYITAPLSVREQRCSGRSDYNAAFKLRCEKEDEQFNEFEDHKRYDYIISNGTDGRIEYNIAYVLIYMIQEWRKNKDVLFCVVGRTGAGKDTFITTLKKLLNKK